MFSDMVTAKAGEGAYTVGASAVYLGNDISVAVTGGTHPHIGAVSLGVYEEFRDSATVSTVSVYSHRDDAVSSYFAKCISRAIKHSVTVSAGIHIDDASDDDIKLLWENAKECCRRLVEAMEEK